MIGKQVWRKKIDVSPFERQLLQVSNDPWPPSEKPTLQRWKLSPWWKRCSWQSKRCTNSASCIATLPRPTSSYTSQTCQPSILPPKQTIKELAIHLKVRRKYYIYFITANLLVPPCTRVIGLNRFNVSYPILTNPMDHIKQAQLKIIDFNASKMFNLDDSPIKTRQRNLKLDKKMTEEQVW